MTDNEKVITITKAVEKYGCEAQLKMVIEECSELTQAICKWFRNPDDAKNAFNIAEELADVFIMLNQMYAMFDMKLIHNDVTRESIKKFQNEKLERLKMRLKNIEDSAGIPGA